MFIGVPTLQIGRGCFISWFAMFEGGAGVSIGADTFLGPQVSIFTMTFTLLDEYSVSRAGPVQYSPVSIGNGCWIGARTTIMPGVTVGDGCVIDAGSVVTSNCESDGVYAGNPAIRTRDLAPRIVE
jgi:acetyltransferase-like isoleucine patch superfamily enzyme